MRNLFRRPAVWFVVAHVVASYVWVGAIALFSVLTRPDQPTPTIEPGFHDADGSGYDDADEPDVAWYLRPSVAAASAPVSVPCLLVVTLLVTFASPVERLPVPACLILLALYFVPLGLTYTLLRRRLRPRENESLNWAGPTERPL